jgi:UDP-N-acetylglucosamine transferase subunit ALG13
MSGSVLLVAATGGHLAQLDRLASRIPSVDENALWVTFENPQSRALLRDRRHVFVPYVGPRDATATLAAMRVARRIIRSEQPSAVVSTGNAIAVSFLPVASAMGIPAAYIESAARADGPSLTGRLLRRTPGVQLFTQSTAWSQPPWSYIGSVFDEFTLNGRGNVKQIERVVVTLGTIRFSFRRLVERLVRVLPPACEVVWQVGDTDVSGLNISAHRMIDSTALRDAMARADVVVAHAGIGSALAALEVGRCPVLVPRERDHAEHVDDHQHQIARSLASAGLAVHAGGAALNLRDLEDAAHRVIDRRTDLPPVEIRI